MYIFLLERYKVINLVAEYERERKACYSARHVFGSTEPYVKTKSLQVKRPNRKACLARLRSVGSYWLIGSPKGSLPPELADGPIRRRWPLGNWPAKVGLPLETASGRHNKDVSTSLGVFWVSFRCGHG
jgi:hypothetical protein